eukprot:comp8702_c0_seq1/m.3957 comp8702_c0_seq1/g.3957  ORF comp8702_c0_seq1/g.3957 comp8702_c0_seq1/m.3957 type:complete len:467 (-) comp8702_c0_seq1:272-1672(-)
MVNAGTNELKVVSPVDGSVYVTRPLATEAEIDAALAKAHTAFKTWKTTPVKERVAICSRFAEEAERRKDEIAKEITWQMGRPISQAPGEVRGLLERARHMTSIADECLRDVQVAEKEGFTRFIRKEPLGVVFIVAAWNYPYLIAVNAIIPAILAGNTVVLKHSAQTPLVGERFAECLKAAGLPDGVFQVLHVSHAATERIIKDARVEHVAFTGSVDGGRQVNKAASERFIGVGLELGGKDPAYVRADCNLPHAIENLVDGAFFNSGQSCCGIERIYVHEAVYDEFVKGFVELTKQYRLGDPTDPNTNLGPVVRTSAADWVRKQIREAVAAGAKSLLDESLYPASTEGTPYLSPHVLVDVTHDMSVMREESFGPVIGIMKVSGDEEAIEKMNDSCYGLTACIWTNDMQKAVEIGSRVDTGTWYCNRCDYLDPALAWVGVKDSGRGCTLSQFGFDHLTRPKSFHIRHL